MNTQKQQSLRNEVTQNDPFSVYNYLIYKQMTFLDKIFGKQEEYQNTKKDYQILEMIVFYASLECNHFSGSESLKERFLSHH